MKILVTGGAGFIGSHVVEALIGRGEFVRIIDNFSTGKLANVAPFKSQIEIIEGDIRSYHIVREAVDEIEVVLHQAALPSVPRSVRDPITTNEVNIAGTLNVLQAAKDANVKRIIYASSSSIYGDNPELPKQEDMTPNPLSPYAVSKLAGENYCRVFTKTYGLETIALRYFNVFGPRQDPDSQYAAVIPKFVKAILQGQQPVIYGDGRQSRDFTYVANVVQANLLAISANCEVGTVFNCACHKQIALMDLVEHINKMLGKDITPIIRDTRPGDVKHSYADISRAQAQLGYEPVISFEEGLKRVVQYIRSISSVP